MRRHPTLGRNPGARFLIRGDGTTHGTLHSAALESAVCQDALTLIGQERSELRTYTISGAEQGPTPIVESDERPHGAGAPAYLAATTTAGEAHVFIDAHPALPTLVIFGAVHTAIPLAKFARAAGFRVRVVDARAQLCTKERFPDAEQLLVAWPDEVAGGPRNQRLDLYRHLDPRRQVRRAGVGGGAEQPRPLYRRYRQPAHAPQACRSLAGGRYPAEQVARVRGPIGLDLGSQTAEEVALSVLAEMIAVRRGGSAVPMSQARR